MLLTFYEEHLVEVGLDEAGRGCLAGPVVAAAVILPGNWNHPLLNDSKKLNAETRNLLRTEIIANALAWAVGEADNFEIDEINILNASFLAMHRALDQIQHPYNSLLVDGNRFKPYGQIPHTCLIGGDGRFVSIAAASILAKTHRDALMQNLAEKHPEYHWHRNAGYPTVAHRDAIREHGTTRYHRLSFRLLQPADTELLSEDI
ncbi:MAG: ribonuclease HII [Bacteroidota bacterium]